MRRKWQPPKSGEFKVKPGRRVIWLSRPSTLSVLFVFGGIVSILLGLIAIGVPVVPIIWHTIKPDATARLASILHEPVAPESQSTAKQVDLWQPEKDETLPKGGHLAIPAIKVKTAITEAETQNYESALRVGVWRVPDFGNPHDRQLPTILVAHRFGYLKWTNNYRMLHSFYNLPKLKVGDKVYIAWDQREYTYEVYAGDEGTEITDYSADLILYTCQYLESDRRIFRYAKLIKQ